MKAITRLVFLATHASAQTGLGIEGWTAPGAYYDTPEAAQAIAGQPANATSSVTFTRPTSDDDSSPETWSFRLNIADVAVPNRPSELGMPDANNSLGLHVLNTQWQLEWPGSSNQSFQSYLSDYNNMSVTVSPKVYNLPSSIIGNYPDMSNGSCVPVLGDVCSRSLFQEASKGSPLSISAIEELEGCGSSLTVDNAIGGGSSYSYLPANGSDTRGLLYPGDTMYYETSATYPADNLTLFHQAERALHILVIGFRSRALQFDTVDTQPIVACQIVDKTAELDSAAVRLSWNMGVLWVAGLCSIAML